MLDDGSVWEYRGIGYPADNRERVRGWERLGLTALDLID